MKKIVFFVLVITSITAFAESRPSRPVNNRAAIAKASAPAASLATEMGPQPASNLRLYIGYMMPVPFDSMGPELSMLWRLRDTSSYFGFTTALFFGSSAVKALPFQLTYQYRVETLDWFHPYFGMSLGALTAWDSKETALAMMASTRVGLEFAPTEEVAFFIEPKLALISGSGVTGFTFYPVAGFSLGF